MRIPTPEEVLSLAQDLREARDTLSHLEAMWAALFLPEEHLGPKAPKLKPRIIELLELHPDDNYTVASVSLRLKANEHSIGPYLSTLASEGKIERRGRGLYGALRDHHLEQEHAKEWARIDTIHGENTPII